MNKALQIIILGCGLAPALFAPSSPDRSGSPLWRQHEMWYWKQKANLIPESQISQQQYDLIHLMDMNNLTTFKETLKQTDPNFVYVDLDGRHHTPLTRACSKGIMPVVKLLLKYGAKPSLKPFETSAISIAKGHPEMTQLLVQYGAGDKRAKPKQDDESDFCSIM